VRRTNNLRDESIAKGVLPNSVNRRVAIYIAPDMFDLLREMAVVDGIGVGTVAARMVEAAILEKGPRS
jgi:hypothetical protein